MAEMFPEGKKRALKLRTSLKLAQIAGEELATFVEVERYPSADARAREVLARLERALVNLRRTLEE